MPALKDVWIKSIKENKGRPRLYLDGREVHSAAFTVPVGAHVLALHLESAASFILSAERDPEPQARLLFCSLADDSWRATDQTPPDNWNQPEFIANWPALQECEAAPELQQRWAYPRLTQAGARTLGRPGAGPLWVRKSFELIDRHYGEKLTIGMDDEDQAVYDMLCRGESIGVFQVESRAQLSFLPRMRPREFYDLVIEVAIVRPGPIQGGMVHPYLRRRRDQEEPDYPSDALGEVLKRTLGVPLFQEQAMRIAIVGAGFDPNEADQLRRSLATFRRMGTIGTFRERFLSGMAKNGYQADFAERCFRQIEGFGEYGFPESHAASFALLVYASAWIKRHHPAAFTCALLNAQPMGFYAPAQLVRDAREHGVIVRPVCVNASDWDNTLEPDGRGGLALRLGLRQIKGVSETQAGMLTEARGNGYPDVAAVWRRAGAVPRLLATLAEADAFAGLGLTRREALWQVRALGAAPLPLFAGLEDETGEAREEAVALPTLRLGEEVVADYSALRLTLRAHPMALIRPRLDGLTAKSGRDRARPGET